MVVGNPWWHSLSLIVPNVDDHTIYKIIDNPDCRNVADHKYEAPWIPAVHLGVAVGARSAGHVPGNEIIFSKHDVDDDDDDDYDDDDDGDDDDDDDDDDE